MIEATKLDVGTAFHSVEKAIASLAVTNPPPQPPQSYEKMFHTNMQKYPRDRNKAIRFAYMLLSSVMCFVCALCCLWVI